MCRPDLEYASIWSISNKSKTERLTYLKEYVDRVLDEEGEYAEADCPWGNFDLRDFA